MRRFINLVNQLLDSSFGLRVQPSSSERLRRTRQRVLENFGCKLVIDVGANNGDWARTLRTDGYEGHIESFEPTIIFEALRQKALGDDLWSVHNLALSDFSGEANINVADNEFLSSSLLAPTGIFESNQGISFNVGGKVKVTTLDKHFSGSSGENVYLKLDVQGAELSVMKGGEKFLENCRAIEFESALIPQYAGESSHYDIVNWLHAKGFKEKQVVITHWNKDLETIALDSIFIRK